MTENEIIEFITKLQNKIKDAYGIPHDLTWEWEYEDAVDVEGKKIGEYAKFFWQHNGEKIYIHQNCVDTFGALQSIKTYRWGDLIEYLEEGKYSHKYPKFED